MATPQSIQDRIDARTDADTLILVRPVSTQFNNVSQGGNIGGAVGSRLYLSKNGEARFEQKTPGMGMSSAELYLSLIHI